MKYQTDVNEVQASIMRQLFTYETRKFSQINVDAVPSDLFSYHLRQLIKYGIVEKTPQGLYRLSVMGRSRTLLLDKRSNKFIEQGFVASRVLLTRQVDGQTEYLMQKRTKVPYKGHITEPGGKILFGEDVVVAARRNMLAETGLDCDMQVCGIVHFKDSYLDRIVQDKYFFVLRASNPKGKLRTSKESGENLWMTLEQIKAHPKTHQGVLDMIAIAEGSSFSFAEQTHVVAEY